ncbi:3-oxoacyl-[acyl-carrier-protein] reductase FabG [Clostridium pasteurianum DSM 525 = ATCC 6013]|uniref:3-oxoacyl-[acyl-carrier-protein] reductase n=1 Tax=Clostridium pasteurianum DSM 525 = ATCC 6013 TaxID=1262449 RepID=A0A0H3JAY8_CLOPA|nr:3-oxoacyl-[acyl-carrier-protein] reductase [Clostridium pasteurianum]AJA49998.1 3-oxoacyl-[acyl-carrier-protein] reductase FabG [Clostridium pasteurianum DSM 525 = ATCC 6013]AJA53986.1 3-oxoacyl-[acyl-carrier-protein] reductase FabG [Clostridium pasteurianum DSM 525 = ATCC 6013]AOZ77129.1 3-ketoacyl-ACP reductase [Clostridium pasteurianum DSM 525 = ATCC 6013]AOZ80926.1 3-ketoacyl-ACP reductase [Clostridium pasteurianum]ELP59292.1 3-ketoacyl-(acyl-carrier-protein) reductase [Clostridium past
MKCCSLKERTAIVTGASRGIGKAIALKLADMGANLVVNYRSSTNGIEELLEEIKEKGVKGIAVQADVSKFEEAEKLVKSAKDTFGSVDILVNNAGITKDTLLLRMKEEDFDSVINVNLKGTFNTIKHVSSIMLKQKAGKIINISSVVGITGNFGQLNYSSAKAGILGLTKSAARELGSRGITVNAVAPGFIQTDMTEILSDKLKENIKDTIPLKVLGSPEDVANLVGFLASDMASYITGQVINVDGGMVMQ